MTERRCLFCMHMRTDDDNPAAAEREAQMRFGPEVALGIAIAAIPTTGVR